MTPTVVSGSRTRDRLSMALLALLSGAAPLDAQTIRGRVLDASAGVGVAEAVVEVLLGEEVVARTSTGPEGRYEVRFPGAAAAIYVLRVSAFGYPSQTSHPFDVSPLEAVELELGISPTPLALEGFLVQVNRVNLRHAANHEGLYARREIARPVGRERVVVRGDPEMQNAARVEDVLRWFSFRESQSRSGEGLRRYQTRYGPRGGCVSWYLNGSLRDEAWIADIPMELIEGVEYYANDLFAPQGIQPGPCPGQGAAVLVWTRRPDPVR